MEYRFVDLDSKGVEMLKSIFTQKEMELHTDYRTMRIGAVVYENAVSTVILKSHAYKIIFVAVSDNYTVISI